MPMKGDKNMAKQSIYTLKEGSKYYIVIENPTKEVESKIESLFGNVVGDLSSILVPEQTTDSKEIAQEIDYVKNQYNVRKKMFIGYDRRAYAGIQEEDVRITFDTNIRYRLHDLSLNEIGEETVIQNPNEILLEIKIMDRYPIWLSNALSEMKLYKNSFSKYGIIYEALQNKEKNETNIVLNQSEEVLQTCSLLY